MIGGEDEGELRPQLRNALDKLRILGVGVEEGLWIRPAFDGQHVVVEDGNIWDAEAPV